MDAERCGQTKLQNFEPNLESRQSPTNKETNLLKKLLTTLLALAAGTFLAHAQGTITIGNTTVAFLIETNTNDAITYVPGFSPPITGSATVRTLTTANSFFYAVLTQTTGANTSGGMPGGAPSSNPFNASWLDTGVGGKNSTLTRGGITAVGNTTANGTWAAPTGLTYDTGSVQWYLIVGWSANLGTTWSQAKANFSIDGLGINGGSFGQSSLAYQVAGGGPNNLSPVSLWGGGGTGIAGAGLNTGFRLDAIFIPEPGTFTLVGLGAAAMFVSRRKK